MIYLRRDRYSKGVYHKLKSKKIGPCKILKKISFNAYLVELSDNLQISPIFSVSDLFDFHTFNEEMGDMKDDEWVDQ